MAGNSLRRALLVIPLGLATLAGCNDTVTTAPKLRSTPLLAQGDNGVWTVNTMLDGYDGVCDDTHCTVSEAVYLASSGGRVVFAIGLQGAIQLTFGTSWDARMTERASLIWLSPRIAST